MNYATQDDLVRRFGEGELLDLADRDNDGVIDTEVVDGALADAASLIDSYIGRRVSLPLDPVPAVLERVACNLARYFLYEDRATEEVRKRHEEAVSWLRAVSRGEATLGADAPATTTGGSPAYEAGRREFDDDALKGF